ncbi:MULTISPECIES: hypothetical protein [unclassified Rhizobium]|uniref:hypothetical protein n=1 Tax=unclassified Rhizobium TaxID=2613769 RepID=UPI001AE397C4|nr:MULTISPECIES: hypothetical protein [unclassified Rhizobium]MBP2461494.1 hypothetical protein [Rhizobium sp. PvP014]
MLLKKGDRVLGLTQWSVAMAQQLFRNLWKMDYIAERMKALNFRGRLGACSHLRPDMFAECFGFGPISSYHFPEYQALLRLA